MNQSLEIHAFIPGGNTQKISFPMPTAKNRFQILNLHPKKRIATPPKKTILFLFFTILPFIFYEVAYKLSSK